MRLIDADHLKEKSIIISDGLIYKEVIPISTIDNAPTVFDCRTCKHNGDERECADCYGDHSNFVKYEDRPQGEWIEKVERRGCFAGDKTVYSYTCPFCGAKEFKKYPFCHCGADMRGKEND
jgi:hypothetical protein